MEQLNPSEIEETTMNYLTNYQQSIENPEEFWQKQAEAIQWYTMPKSILSKDDNGHYRWFSGGTLNTCYLALDYHIEQGYGEQLALIYDSPVSNTQKKYTFNQFRFRVFYLNSIIEKWMNEYVHILIYGGT